jgi:hypothetical protein
MMEEYNTIVAKLALLYTHRYRIGLRLLRFARGDECGRSLIPLIMPGKYSGKTSLGRRNPGFLKSAPTK